jgi:putative ABC transport system permease protein
VLEDVRFALRQLVKNPGFAVAAVFTLALGIGAMSAMFGLIQGVLLSPPPYGQPGRLVFVTPARVDGKPYTDGNTIGQWISWKSARTIEPPALYRWGFNFLVLPDGSESLGGMVVTPDFFRRVGLKPILGREFTDAEAGRPRVAPAAIILGNELWRRRFNGDPSILGKTVRISRMAAPLPVVGVMPPGIRFMPDPSNASEPNYDVNAFVDFWMATIPDETRPRSNGWNAVTRLRDGASLAQAQTELSALAVTQADADADLRGITTTVRPLVEELNQEGRRLLVPLFASVALVFFVACVNVAGLSVARGLQRHREYAMRAALGASRGRIIRQLLTESAALSMVSVVVAAGVAIGTVNLLKAISGHAVPRADAVAVGWPVFAFGCAAALLAAIVAGLLPAHRAASPQHLHALKGARTSAGRAERRLLGAIATVQIVFTVALLAGAALLVRTMSKLASIRPGYQTENILAVTVTTMTPNTSRQFHTSVLERVAAIPGVRRAAFVWGLPLTGNKWGGDMQLVDQTGSTRAADAINFPLRSVTEDYFDLMGIDIVEGRAFRKTDADDSPRVMIVNQTLAKRYFPAASAIGKQFRFSGDSRRTPFEIVGVVSDTRTEALSERAEPEVYLPFWQNGAFSKHLVVRASGDPLALTTLMRQEIRTVDPTSAVERFTTMAQIRRDSVAPRTFAMRLLVGFSLVTAALALVGIYGVISLSVGTRLKEIAVRKAVGAQRSDILRLILGEGGRLILTGVALGAIVAIFVGRALEAQLFEVTPADPRSLAAAAFAFAAVAFTACLLPAVRAARTDSIAALHQE